VKRQFGYIVVGGSRRWGQGMIQSGVVMRGLF
jgi:hypothetical protein